MKFDQLIAQHLISEDLPSPRTSGFQVKPTSYDVPQHKITTLDAIADMAHVMDERELNKELLNKLHLRQLDQELYLTYLQITQGDIINSLSAAIEQH